MFYITRHAPNGKSYTYPAGYAVEGVLLRIFLIAIAPMLLLDVIRHGRLISLVLAIPGLWIVGVKLARLGFFAAMWRMWSERKKPHVVRPNNVVDFRRR